MAVRRRRRAGVLAVVWLLCVTSCALAGQEVYGGQEEAVSGLLYPYDAPEGCCLIDLEGNVYADDGYYWIYPIVSDAGERRFVAAAADGGDMDYYLLDGKGRRMTDGEATWISLTGDGIAFCSRDGLYGLYGWDGETLVEPAYKELMATGDGSYIGLLDDSWQIKNGGADLIRPDGRTGRIRLGDSRVTEIGTFSDGLATASIPDGEGSLTGFIDAAGRWVIPPVYDYAEPFSGDCAVVSLGGFYGLIDRRGNTILPFVYDDIRRDDDGGVNALAARQGATVTVFDPGSFSPLFQVDDVSYCWFEGSAALVTRRESNGQARAFDLDGDLICDLWDGDKVLTIINDSRYYINDYSDYTYALYDFEGNLLMSGSGQMYDRTGGDGAYALSVAVFDAIVYDDGYTGIDWNSMRYGLYDLDGRELLEPKYDFIVSVCEGFFAVRRGQWHGVVDLYGDWILRRSNYSTLMD